MATTTGLMTSQHLRDARHASDFLAELSKCSDAAIGVILIRTREPYRAQETIQEYSIAEQIDFKVWTCITGWQSFPVVAGGDDDKPINQPLSQDQATIDVLKAFQKFEEFKQDGVFIMMNAEFSFDKPPIQQHIRAFVRRAIIRRQRLIFLVPETTKIPPQIEDDLHIMEYKTPSHAELREIWTAMLPNVQEDWIPAYSDEEVDLIIQNSVGMSAYEFDTALAVAFVELRARLSEDHHSKKRTVHPDDFIKIISRAKVEVVKRTDILEIMAPAKMADIGGLDILKKWLRDRRAAYSDDAKEFGISPPRGALLVGPPGTAKSLSAKATAGELCIPALKLDIGKVFGKYVGESEERMRKALTLVDGMAPCVLMIDEIDKGFGGMGNGSGDSGTGSRVLGSFLTWMQERDQSKAPVFVIMTANNVIGLPPELMRKGRIDEIFAVTFPTQDERIDIIRIHLEKRGHKLSVPDMRRVAVATDKFVGAELESIVADALIDVFSGAMKDGVLDKKKLVLTADDLLRQAQAVTPLSKAHAEKVNVMHEWAKQNAKPASTNADFSKIDNTAPGGTTITGRTGGLVSRPAPKGIRKPGTGLDG